MRIYVFIIIALTVAVTSCHHNSFSISGQITGAGTGEYVVLEEVKPGILEPVDSVVPSVDGSFSIKGETPWPSFYTLSFDKKNYMTLLISPGEDISIKADRNSFTSAAFLSGSEGTSILSEFQEKHSEAIAELEKLNKVYEDSIASHNLPVIMDSLDRKAALIVADFHSWSVEFINRHISSMATLFLLNQHIVPSLPLFDPAKDPEIFFRVDSSLYSQYPKSDLVLDLHSFAANLRNSESLNSKKEPGIAVGDTIPEIALPDPEGDTISLSSTRGKLVLVDFWAAWCPPCRQENPNLVKLYTMYHSRGFEIFQVSLDMKKEDWTEAIRNDRLARWIHVSDLKYRDSEVIKKFGITGIPYNLLVDRNGIVIDANLRGAELQKKLEELLMVQ